MKTNSELLLCAVCGSGRLHNKETYTDVSFGGVTGKVRTFHSECDGCGSDVADEKQALQNKREWIRFKKSVERIPLGSEVLKMRLALGLTQLQAGQLFGGGPVAFSKYENDDLLPDESMSNLLYLVIHYPDVASLIAERKGISNLAGNTGIESFFGPGDECHTWKPVSSGYISFVSSKNYEGVDRRKKSATEVHDDFESNMFYETNGGEERWVMQ